MDNIFIRTDPAGNIKPDKEKSTEKIDGVVATTESVYDRRSIFFHVMSIYVFHLTRL